MKLIIQPGDGAERLIKGIRKAKKSVEVMIFRFDRAEIERALIDAVERGVFVHALVAFTNRGGEQNLRKLEKRFLANGITVARTAGDLVRYHGKMMIVDRKELYLLSFNLTHLDIEHSRSFGVVTRNRQLVQEAGKRARRWAVERSHSWMNCFRRILVRWEKKAENYLGLIQLACSITVYRRIILG